MINFVKKYITVVNVLFACLAMAYIYLYVQDISPFWFDRDWTTDDAMQQAFPFHAVHYPHIFEDDLIYIAMKGYLAPLHYWLGYGLTWLTADPIMTAHWLMLIQILAASVFLFLAVKHAAGFAPACFAVAWMFHTRPLMQRITGGLPRGWGAPILAGFLYFALTKNHKGMLVLLLLGCLLHPPATFLAAVAYGFILLWDFLWKEKRAQAGRNILSLALLSPVYLLVVFWVVDRPDYIGSMATFEQASEMPEFSHPGGRFPFVPLMDYRTELKEFSFDAFTFRFRRAFTPRFLRDYWSFTRDDVRTMAVGAFGLLIAIAALRRRAIPAELFCYLAAIVLVYFASREMAFRLYVPNRHLQFPMAMFFISFFSIVTWRVLHLKPEATSGRNREKSYFKDSSIKYSFLSIFGLLAVSTIVYLGSTSGLHGSANFNYSTTKKGNVWLWTRKFTPQDALIAGQPTHIDGVQLFGLRRGYATTETAHPFYPVYFSEIRRRLEISLRAHYAKDFNELLELLEPEGIDYFVFERNAFYPESLETAWYFRPLNKLVDELTSRHYSEYAFRQLPAEVNLESFPAMPFRDEWSVVVDLKALREYVDTQLLTEDETEEPTEDLQISRLTNENNNF